MSDSFTTLLTPPPNTMFSSSWYRHLTFEEASQIYLRMPPLLPENSVVSSLTQWKPDLLVMPIHEHVIPAVGSLATKDIRQLLDSVPERMKPTIRSVQYTVHCDGIPHTLHLPLPCLQVMLDYSQIKDNIFHAALIMQHVLELEYPLPSHVVDTFRGSAVTGYAKGFHEKLRLVDLQCLIGNLEVWEDVANAATEIIYWRGLFSAPGYGDPQYLILSTMIWRSAVYCYGQDRGYSPLLSKLRNRIVRTEPRFIGWLVAENGHYVLWWYNTSDGTLSYFDSLNATTQPAHIMPTLAWLLKDLSNFMSPQAISQIFGGIQDYGSQGCALAALNMLECQTYLTNTRWRTGQDFQVLMDWNLGLILSWHHYAYPHDDVDRWCTEDVGLEGPSTASSPYDLESDFCFKDYEPNGPTEHPFLGLDSDIKDIHGISDEDPGTPRSSSADHLVELEMQIASGREATLSNVQTHESSGEGTRSPSIPPLTSRWRRRLPSSSPSHSVANSSDSTDVLAPLRRSKVRQTTPILASAISSPERIRKKGKVKFDLPSNPAKKSRVVYPPTPHTSHGIRRMRVPNQSGVIEISSDSEDAAVTQRRTGLLSLLSPKQQRPLNIANPEDPITISSDSDSTVDNEEGDDVLYVGASWNTLEEVKRAIDERQELLGFVWMMDQSQCFPGTKSKRRQVFRCSASGVPGHTHDTTIDPGNHRLAKSQKKGCAAYINANYLPKTSKWRLTTLQLKHNHQRELAPGATARRPATSEQYQFVSDIVQKGKFSRRQLGVLLEHRSEASGGQNQQLLPRQLENLMARAKREARQVITEGGGSFEAIRSWLLERRGDGWVCVTLIDENGIVEALFWQSPQQVELARRYSDLLLTDGSYNRNEHLFVLSVGVIIDGFSRSRNAWYAMHRREDNATVDWILDQHLMTAGRPPEVFFSDGHSTYESSAKRRLPLTSHLLCLYHINDDNWKSLKGKLGNQWPEFQSMFWRVYCAVSPEHFEYLFRALTRAFPSTQDYLMNRLYPRRMQWAHAFTSMRFTAGIRTIGRVECENRISRQFLSAKSTAFEAFTKLRTRTDEQHRMNHNDFRQSNRQTLEQAHERLYSRIFEQVREHGGPFAISSLWIQTKEAMHYRVNVVNPPVGQTWDNFTITSPSVDSEEGFNAQTDHDLQSDINDEPFVSITYLLQHIRRQHRGNIRHVMSVKHVNPDASRHHVVVITRDDSFWCDCSMPVTHGVPCRHFYAVMRHGSTTSPIYFHLSMIRPRWLVDPALNVGSIPNVCLTHTGTTISPASQVLAMNNSGHIHPRPRPRLSVNGQNSEAANGSSGTLGMREVWRESQAAVSDATRGIETRTDLNTFVDYIGRYNDNHSPLRTSSRLVGEHGSQLGSAHRTPSPSPLLDPPIHKHRGRPRDARLTSSREGPPSGGGGRRKRTKILAGTGFVTSTVGAPRVNVVPVSPTSARPSRGVPKCSLCGQTGHNRRRCLEVTVERQASLTRQSRERSRARRLQSTPPKAKKTKRRP